MNSAAAWDAVPVCERCGEPLAPADRFCEACGSRRPDPLDHLEIALPGVAAVSNRGLRHQHNEDAVELARLDPERDGVAAVLAVVCDGVSSGPRPDLAASAAARAGATALADALRGGSNPAEATRAAVAAAGDAVATLATRPGLPAAPACTFVSTVHTEAEVTVGWVGDSRAYWLPATPGLPGVQLTEDDSWLAVTLAEGLMSPDRAAADHRAHALVGWLGADAPGTPRITALRPTGPGLVLVCTDGLWNYLPDPGALAAALPPDAARDPLRAARSLVRAALLAGGRDNVTVVLLPHPDDPAEGETR